MARRVGGHADGEAADGVGQLDQFAGVGELPGAGVRILGRIAPERHQILDARLAQRHQDVGQLQAGVGNANQMGHRVEPGGVQHARNQVEGALPRLRPSPVGDRDERWFERLELTDGAGQRGQLLVVLGREELEGVRRAGRQELRDPRHDAAPVPRP